MHAAATRRMPDSQLADHLTRPVEQVRRRRHLVVGPRPPARAYSSAEDERVRQCWAQAGDVDALAHEPQALGRVPAPACTGPWFYRPHPRLRWSVQEDATLRDGYEQALSCTQIARHLPGRSEGAIAARAAKLGLATYARLWSPNDDQRLRLLSEMGITVESIAQALGRTPTALVLRARRLGIALPRAALPPRDARRWTAEEDAVLRTNGALNPAILAGVLGRSSSAITQRMSRLGLRTERSPHHPAVRRGGLTPGERATAVRELRAGGPARIFALARRLGAPPQAIREAMSELEPRAHPCNTGHLR